MFDESWILSPRWGTTSYRRSIEHLFDLRQAMLARPVVSDPVDRTGVEQAASPARTTGHRPKEPPDEHDDRSSPVVAARSPAACPDPAGGGPGAAVPASQAHAAWTPGRHVGPGRGEHRHVGAGATAG